MKQPRILLIFLHLFPKIIVCQPLISGEAAASPASPVPTPLINIPQVEIDIKLPEIIGDYSDLCRFGRLVKKLWILLSRNSVTGGVAFTQILNDS